MTDSWLSLFAAPSAPYRPIPFWSWNETLEPDELRRQLQLIKDAGWGGALLHARVGLRSEYLGEAWFAACAAAIEQGKRLGLQIWIYDEEGWPSGISGGTVPSANPAFRQKTLFARPVGAVPPPGSVPLGEPAHGVQVYCWTSPLGSWRFNGACYADLLSREAMAAFLDDAYATYHRRFAAAYGGTVTAEFLDEPCAVVHVQVPAGSLPWTEALFPAFLEQHGYAVEPYLHLLFCDGPDAARIRIHYARSASRLFERNFTQQLGDWCVRKGIALTGHFMEGGLYEQQALGNRVPPNYRHQAIPGIDHLCLQVDEVITAKQCHGVVNQYDKPQMLCETYGAAGQHLSFAERWWIGIHLLSLGVTRFVPHLALYTMAGCRKRDFPPNLFHQQPWWPMNTAVDEPLTRLGVALAQGRAIAEALVLHPQDSAAALFCVRSDWSESAALDGGSTVTTEAVRAHIEHIDQEFHAVVLQLLSAQRVFDLGDEVILADDGRCTVEQGRPLLRVGAMAYPAVILPTMLTLARTTFVLLKDFLAAGGTVICAGTPPNLIDGCLSSELISLLATCPRVTPSALPDELARVAAPHVCLRATADISQVYVQIRDLPDGERLVFIADRRRSGLDVAVVAQFAGNFTAVHRLDPFTGREAVVSNTGEASFTLHPASVQLLRLSSATVIALPVPPPQRALPQAVSWSVTRADDNALTLDCACWREAPSEAFTSTAIPVVAIQGRLDELRYHGPLALRYHFTVGELTAGRRVQVVIEYPERYQIRVNGSTVCYAGLAPYRDFRFLPIDISALVRPGDNCIELTLAMFRYAESNAPRERQADRTGTEIEAIYLIGDFHIAGERISDGPEQITATMPFARPDPQDIPPLRLSYLRQGTLTLCDPVALTLGDVTSQGLPFYAGRLFLTATLAYALAAPAQLCLTELDAAVADISANGMSLGALFTQPLAIEIPAGTTQITITLYATLRNLLGPHHHLAGDPINTAPWFFLPYCGDGHDRARNTLAWAQGRFQPENHRESYACVSFGHTGEITLWSTAAMKA
jgi:hypothetical protein